MSVFIYYKAVFAGLRGFFAKVKISYVFDLQERSITLQFISDKMLCQPLPTVTLVPDSCVSGMGGTPRNCVAKVSLFS